MGQNSDINKIYTSSDSMVDMYNKYVDPWNNSHRYDKFIKDMFKNISLENNSLLIDIGAGEGHFSQSIINYLSDKNNRSNYKIVGVDISDKALSRGIENKILNDKLVIDLSNIENDINKDSFIEYIKKANLIYCIDVLYYFKYKYRLLLDLIWNNMMVGATIIVADCLIRFNYRDYLKSKKDMILIDSYNSVESVSDPEDSFRSLKVRIYKKDRI